jgi:hypothetical protein
VVSVNLSPWKRWFQTVTIGEAAVVHEAVSVSETPYGL